VEDLGVCVVRWILRRFNSATAVKPWKTAGRFYAQIRETSFNSATAVKPWKTWLNTLNAGDTRCFNSATAVKPWKTAGREPAERAELLLQFGHGGEAVEDDHSLPWATGPHLASIRPRR